jgi:hypothetical protein
MLGKKVFASGSLKISRLLFIPSPGLFSWVADGLLKLTSPSRHRLTPNAIKKRKRRIKYGIAFFIKLTISRYPFKLAAGKYP